MRLFSRKPKKTVMQLQGDTATATRVLYMGKKELPRIEIKFEVKGTDPSTGEHFDELIMELDAWEASKLCQQLITSIDTALPHRPKGMSRTPFGE